MQSRHIKDCVIRLSGSELCTTSPLAVLLHPQGLESPLPISSAWLEPQCLTNPSIYVPILLRVHKAPSFYVPATQSNLTFTLSQIRRQRLPH